MLWLERTNARIEVSHKRIKKDIISRKICPYLCYEDRLHDSRKSGKQNETEHPGNPSDLIVSDRNSTLIRS
jgi:hypothetical protein